MAEKRSVSRSVLGAVDGPTGTVAAGWDAPRVVATGARGVERARAEGAP